MNHWLNYMLVVGGVVGVGWYMGTDSVYGGDGTDALTETISAGLRASTRNRKDFVSLPMVFLIAHLK